MISLRYLDRSALQCDALITTGQLTKIELPVEVQVREFIRLAGKPRRTFFNYRQNEALTTTPEKVQVAQVCGLTKEVADG